VELCQSWIKQIARQTTIFPNSVFLEGITELRERSVPSGGIWHVYSGMYSGQEVAIKVLRFHPTNEDDQDTLIQVREI
jgi:hypothetical protein